VHRITLSKSEREQVIPIPAWKQFVLSRSEKLNSQQHSIRRSIFWMKEELVGGLKSAGRIVGRWSYGRGRQGILGSILRDAMVLSNGVHVDSELRWYKIVKSEEVGFKATIKKWNGSKDGGDPIPQVDAGRYRCVLREFVLLQLTLTNKTGLYHFSIFASKTDYVAWLTSFAWMYL
jgi:hypothetical protein